MEVNHIKHDDIDLKKWDNTVLSSATPLVFAQSFYLNATSPKWDALVIGDYDSIFPLTAKTKLGLKYLPQPSFTSQLGVFGKINEEIELTFYNYIIKKYRLIEIELNASNKISNAHVSPKRTYTIEYKNGYSYNTNTKRNISKAIKNGLAVTIIEPNDIPALSKKYIDPFLEKELGLAKPVVKTFNVLLASCLKNKSLLTLKTIDSKNNIKALAHFVYNNKYVLYLKGTNFDKSENTGSMHLLIDSAIKHFENRAEIFDFGGGANTGLSSFYQGLGGSQLNYSFLSINNLPKLISVLKQKKK
ncbi:MAG: hypothetical protein H0U95_05615 [Bacteroidetes bacterium]|nr:hypothetical protein [Bacteroidota bacterium]